MEDAPLRVSSPLKLCTATVKSRMSTHRNTRCAAEARGARLVAPRVTDPIDQSTEHSGKYLGVHHSSSRNSKDTAVGRWDYTE